MQNLIVADWQAAEAYISGLARMDYSPADAADIVSAAKMQCLEKYDDTKGKSVKSFMTFCYHQARQAWAIANQALHVPMSTGIHFNATGQLDKMPGNAQSLNATLDTDGEGDAVELQDTVSIEQFTPAEVAMINDTNRTLAAARHTLTEREREIITLLFDNELTLEATGAMVGVTCERVRQIKEKALVKMRKNFRK